VGNGNIIIPEDVGQMAQILGQVCQTQQLHDKRIERMEKVVRNSEQGKMALIVGIVLTALNGGLAWLMIGSLNSLKQVVK
jgi:hypothetical protein